MMVVDHEVESFAIRAVGPSEVLSFDLNVTTVFWFHSTTIRNIHVFSSSGEEVADKSNDTTLYSGASSSS